MGLVITKSIIECMGGEIDFESEEDNGTKFFFTVDFLTAKEKTAEDAQASDERADEGEFVAEADVVAGGGESIHTNRNLSGPTISGPGRYPSPSFFNL